jgi:hypothetical protein
MMKKLFYVMVFFSIPMLCFSQIEEAAQSVDSLNTEVKKVVEQAEKQNANDQINKCVKGDCENGIGTKYYESGTYMGSWKDGLRHGNGKFVWNNGDMYDGEWSEDARHGYGVYKWHDGSVYKGNYSHNIRSGYGIYYYANGNIYEGTWQNNLKHGIANFYYPNSVNIGGKYVDNKYVDGTGINQESYPYKPKEK